MRTRAEFLHLCCRDRDHLLRQICRLRHLSACPVPADVLDEILELMLCMTIIPRALPRDMLGYVDFDLHHVSYNNRMRMFTYPDTYVEGVVNSTMAHELGHLRLDHELLLRALLDTLTPPLFVEHRLHLPAPLFCGRTADPAHMAREADASTYASIFLVPEYQLMQFDEARWIEARCRQALPVQSQVLWDLAKRLGKCFRVTPSLMARRFEDLGWVVKKGPNLSIHPQPWLPLLDLD